MVDIIDKKSNRNIQGSMKGIIVCSSGRGGNGPQGTLETGDTERPFPIRLAYLNNAFSHHIALGRTSTTRNNCIELPNISAPRIITIERSLEP